MTTHLKRNTLAVLLGAALVAPATLVLAPTPAHAATTQGEPSRMVLENSTRVLRTLEARRAEFTSDRAALNAFIASEFDKIFDRDYAARLVLGQHARGASDADVKLFADALATSLMSRYGASLIGFDEGLQVKILGEDSLRGGAVIKVSSEFQLSNNSKVPVDYLMHRSGGQWKVFDVMIAGVSFVGTFRKQFDAPLRSKGIAAVAADLRGGKLKVEAGQ